MKLTEFLSDVGRPIAYYPGLRKITGSVTATILLCQFVYWRGKESGQDGWLYKTSDEIESETGLSYNEQKTARRDLVAAGLVQEYYARLDHQMRFRVDLDKINEKWGNEGTVIPESGKPSLGNDDIQRSLSESENTTKSTKHGSFEPTTIEQAIWADKTVTEEMVNPEKIFRDKVKDTAHLLDMGCKGGGDLAAEFMLSRHLIIPESKIKGNRKAAREMLDMGVKPQHITQAVKDLTTKGMTITDLFSVSKTAIDIANKPDNAPTTKSFAL